MTYRELLKKLTELSEDQLDNMDVTVYDSASDEYFPAYFDIDNNNGVLDDNHPVIAF